MVVEGHCPLCGAVGLTRKRYKGQTWLYCSNGATGPQDAHTAYVVDEAPDPEPAKVETVEARQAPDQESE